MQCNFYNLQNSNGDFEKIEDRFHEHPFENLNICQSVKLVIKGLFEEPRCKECINNIFYALPQLTLEDLNKVQRHPWASLLLASLSLKHPETNDPLFSSAKWREWAASLTAEELVALMNTLFMSPELLIHVPFGEVTALTIKRYGACEHTFAEISRLLMNAETSSKITLHENGFSKALRKAYKKPPLGESIPFLETQEIEQIAKKKFEVFGRTLVCFGNPKKETGIAYKFRREGEDILSFRKEQTITKIFIESKKFLSALPHPIGVFRMKVFPEILKKILSNASIDYDQPMVYVQEVPKGYYKYLHEIEEEEVWRQARRVVLFDTGVQIAHGYMPDLAPIYHGEEDYRRYQPLIDLTPMERQGSGAGRLETPFSRLRWPNLGDSGIRDVGDGRHLHEFIENPYSEGADLFNFKEGKMSYFFMNSLAKTFLIDTLLLFLRFENRGKGHISWEDESAIEKVAHALKEGAQWILEGFTGYNETLCSRFIEAFPVNWKQQALQLIFWLQTDERGYASYLAKGTLPEGLYGPEVKIEIDVKENQNFDPKRGFFKDGERELGCYGGPLGWPEHEKVWYGIAAVALGTYYHTQTDIKKEEIQSRQQKFSAKGKKYQNRSSFLIKKVELKETSTKRKLFFEEDDGNSLDNQNRQKKQKVEEDLI